MILPLRIEFNNVSHCFYVLISQIQMQIHFYNLFTKSTDIHCRYEVPREEPREAHGCLVLNYDS